MNSSGSCLQHMDTTPSFSGTINGRGSCPFNLPNDFLVYAADDSTGVQYLIIYYLNSGACLTANGTGLQLTSACVTTDPNQQFSTREINSTTFSISPRAFPDLCVVSDASLALVPCANQSWSMQHQTFYQPYVSESKVIVTTQPEKLNAFISWAFDQACTPLSCQSDPVHYSDFPGNDGGKCPAPPSGNGPPFPDSVNPQSCDIFVSFNLPNDFGGEPTSLATGMDSLKALLMGVVQTQWATNTSWISTGHSDGGCADGACWDGTDYSSKYTVYSLPSELKATSNRWGSQNSISMSFNAFIPPSDNSCSATLSSAAAVSSVLGTIFNVMPLGLFGTILGAACG